MSDVAAPVAALGDDGVDPGVRCPDGLLDGVDLVDDHRARRVGVADDIGRVAPGGRDDRDALLERDRQDLPVQVRDHVVGAEGA